MNNDILLGLDTLTERLEQVERRLDAIQLTLDTVAQRLAELNRYQSYPFYPAIPPVYPMPQPNQPQPINTPATPHWQFNPYPTSITVGHGTAKASTPPHAQ